MTDFPRATQSDTGLFVEMTDRPAVRTTEFEAILDRDDFGEVLGIEILPLQAQLNAAAPPSPDAGRPSWSYDEECDAFYLRVRDGRVDRTETVVAQASVDDDGLLIAIRMPLTAVGARPPRTQPR